MSALNTVVDLPFTPFATQLAIATDDSRVKYVGGGYGSGKSISAAFAVFLLSLANPWTEAYGETNPTIVVSAPTARIMRDTTLPSLLKVIPHECIRRHRRADNEIELTNGCVIKMRSGHSKFEGLTICGIWIDECSLYDEQFFHNAVARVRDGNAQREAIIVSGIPFEGTWVEEQFREARPGQRAFMLSAYCNPFLPLRSIDELKSRISRDDADTLIFGRWMKKRDLIFPEFSPLKHLRQTNKNAAQPVFCGVDPGRNHSVALIAQLHDVDLIGGGKSKGLTILDEIVFENASVEKLMHEVKAKGWTPAKVFIDPTTRIDEENAIRRVFPGMPIVRQPHRSIHGSEDYGIDCVRTCLEDAAGNVRVAIHERLRDHAVGLVHCLRSYRWNPRTERPAWADDQGDHSIDALRYLCVGLIPVNAESKRYSIRRGR